MSISKQIDGLIQTDDVFISLRITDKCTNKTEVLSNMPDEYKKVYYREHYDDIDDTFDYTESNAGSVCYPSSEGTYCSDYIRTMESHGYYNLVSFTVSGDKNLTCIVTLPRKPRALQHDFSLIKLGLVSDIKMIIKHLSKLSCTSDFDFSTVPDIDQ
jgi:hypothetical protein